MYQAKDLGLSQYMVETPLIKKLGGSRQLVYSSLGKKTIENAIRGEAFAHGHKLGKAKGMEISTSKAFDAGMVEGQTEGIRSVMIDGGKYAYVPKDGPVKHFKNLEELHTDPDAGYAYRKAALKEMYGEFRTDGYKHEAMKKFTEELNTKAIELGHKDYISGATDKTLKDYEVERGAYWKNLFKEDIRNKAKEVNLKLHIQKYNNERKKEGRMDEIFKLNQKETPFILTDKFNLYNVETLRTKKNDPIQKPNVNDWRSNQDLHKVNDMRDVIFNPREGIIPKIQERAKMKKEQVTEWAVKNNFSSPLIDGKEAPKKSLKVIPFPKELNELVDEADIIDIPEYVPPKETVTIDLPENVNEAEIVNIPEDVPPNETVTFSSPVNEPLSNPKAAEVDDYSEDEKIVRNNIQKALDKKKELKLELEDIQELKDMLRTRDYSAYEDNWKLDDQVKKSLNKVLHPNETLSNLQAADDKPGDKTVDKPAEKLLDTIEEYLKFQELKAGEKPVEKPVDILQEYVSDRLTKTTSSNDKTRFIKMMNSKDYSELKNMQHLPKHILDEVVKRYNTPPSPKRESRPLSKPKYEENSNKAEKPLKPSGSKTLSKQAGSKKSTKKAVSKTQSGSKNTPQRR